MANETSSSIRVLIHEPWELAPNPGDDRRSAQLKYERSRDDAEGLSMLIELDAPVEWRGRQYWFLVAQIRSSSKATNEFAAAQVECTFIGEPPERVNAEDRLDVSWWRGGLAGRATVAWPL